MAFGTPTGVAGKMHVPDSTLVQPERAGLSRFVAYSILFAVAWLLAAPRVPLFAIGGSSVRAEDFILVLFGITVLTRWRVLPAGIARSGIVLIVSINMTAAVVAAAAGRVDFLTAGLYSLRIGEYWLILPALYLVFHSLGSGMMPKLLALVTFAQVITAALQTVFGLNIGFSKFSYERGSGLTAGPYELGAMCAMLAVYWIWRRSWFLAVTSVAGVLISASRISIPALLVGIACVIVFQRLWPERGEGITVTREKKAVGPINVVLTVLLFAAAVFALAVYPAVGDKLSAPTLSRYQESSISESWLRSGDMAGIYRSPGTSKEYSFLAYDSLGIRLSQGEFGFGSTSDDSNLVRFFRWHILLDAVNDPLKLIIGLGPSFAGPSVDGSFVRMFAETGLLGLVAWFLAVRKWLQGATPWLFGVLASVLIGATFIDILVAFRPMVLMWALVALSRHELTRKKMKALSLPGQPCRSSTLRASDTY